MPNTLLELKPIAEKLTSTFLHEEPLLYPRVYPADYSYDFDEKSTYSDSLSETEYIEEEPILENSYPQTPILLLPKLGSQGNHSNLIESSITPRVYEYYDELFDKHWPEKSFPRRERDSTHEREEVNLTNP
jgi:hypothetical protein